MTPASMDSLVLLALHPTPVSADRGTADGSPPRQDTRRSSRTVLKQANNGADPGGHSTMARAPQSPK